MFKFPKTEKIKLERLEPILLRTKSTAQLSPPLAQYQNGRYY